MATRTITLNYARDNLAATHRKTNPNSVDGLASPKIHTSLNVPTFPSVTNLTRSLIEEYYPEKQNGQVSQTEVRQMGTTVLDRAEQIYHQTKAIRTLVSN